jgi:hypothetical protein
MVPEGPDVYGYKNQNVQGSVRSPMSRQQMALLWSARCTCFRCYKHLAALRPHYFNLTTLLLAVRAPLRLCVKVCLINFRYLLGVDY